jgi:hypothetical protein
MTVISEVGNWEHTSFWTDQLQGKRIADLAPHLLTIIPQTRRKRQTVKEALMNRAWISDIQGALTFEIIAKYIQLWDVLYDFWLQSEVADSHIWRLSTDGQYLAKSRYDTLFMGATLFKLCERILKSWGHPNARFFYGWSHTNVAGPQTILCSVDCLTRINTCFMIRRMRTLTTSSPHAYSLDNSGTMS